MGDFVNPWSGLSHPTPRKADRVYRDPRWPPLRKKVLDANPLCVHCLKDGRTTLATDVDHILKIEDAPGLSFDIGNLQALCRKCHAFKTRKESKR